MHNSETEAFLAHYGIKGMKWGVRRSQAELDRKAGRKTSTSKKKRRGTPRKHDRRQRKPSPRIKTDDVIYAAAGAYWMYRVFGPSLKKLATMTINTAVQKKMASNGAKVAAEMMADSRGLTNYTTIALAFDQATKTWR